MKLKYLVFQAYLLAVAFSLIAVGIFSLVGHLAAGTEHQNDILYSNAALAGILLGAGILGAVRQWHRFLLVWGCFTALLASYSLIVNVIFGGITSGLVLGLVPIRTAFSLVLLVAAVAVMLNDRGRPGRRFCRIAGCAVVVLACLFLIRAWLSPSTLFAVAVRTFILAFFFAVLAGSALIALTSYSESSRRQMPNMVALLTGAAGVFILSGWWYMLSQHEMAGFEAAKQSFGSVLSILLPAAVLVLSLGLGSFLMLSVSKRTKGRMHLLLRSLEASYNGVVIVGNQESEMPIIYVNRSFERITGYSTDEAMGRNWNFLLGAETNQAEVAKIREAVAECHEVNVIIRCFRKDGIAFWNNLYIAPVPGENGSTITHFIGVIEDISDQRRDKADLAFSASHDVLTGLVNRSLLEDRIMQAIQLSRRTTRPLAVVGVDLDEFKPISDVHGHELGDQILIETARRIEKQVRLGDTVARLAADEFIILLPDLAKDDDVVAIVERVMAAIARPYQIYDHELYLTASLGITMADGNSVDAALLLQQSSLAVNEAKRLGQNNYQWFAQNLNAPVSERVTLRGHLQRAIEHKGLQLHYQPQFDARTNQVTGFEALCRWHHTDMGHISPARFIPVAESTGQIVQLSEWVLEQACRDNRALAFQGFGDHVVAVNISSVHFQRSNFVNTIESILQLTGHPANLLELEITESVFLDNPNRAIETLQSLQEMGVRLSIDDFGTGFSSLNYLKFLPINKIKIDRSFIKDIVSDAHDAAITLGIISMAHHLKLQVTVEGIETEAQREFLAESDCDEFQGFLFATPMAFPELITFLESRRGFLIS